VHGAQPARSITSHTRLWRSAFVPSRSNGCCGSAAEAEQGHGAEAIWGVHPTASIISWIPLMIFAFRYGLSMDYEVFMLTRMRKIYDETGGRTPRSRSGWRGRGSSSRARRSS
jgi:hypothetical protein